MVPSQENLDKAVNNILKTRKRIKCIMLTGAAF